LRRNHFIVPIVAGLQDLSNTLDIKISFFNFPSINLQRYTHLFHCNFLKEKKGQKERRKVQPAKNFREQRGAIAQGHP